MSTVRFKHLLIFIVVLKSGICSYTPKTHYFDQECNTTIFFEKDMILKFTGKTPQYNPSAWLCDVVLQSANISHRLLITPLDLQITTTFSCNDNALYIIDSEGQPLNNPPYICGDHLSRNTLNTTGGYAWFQYNKSDSVENPGSFEFLVTAFTVTNKGKCSSDSFHCNNNICISKDLECNGYNDCGDDTDEDELCHLSLLYIILIGVGGGLVVVVILIAMIKLIARSRKRKNYRSVQGEPSSL